MPWLRPPCPYTAAKVTGLDVGVTGLDRVVVGLDVEVTAFDGEVLGLVEFDTLKTISPCRTFTNPNN